MADAVEEPDIASGVTTGRCEVDRLVALFVMCPQPQYLNDSLSLEHLIHKSVLNIDSSGIGASKIANELLVGRRVLERISRQNIQ